MRASAPTLAILSALLLGGCGGDASPASVAPPAAARPLDPMLSIAIAGPLMSDQQLSHQANLDVLRPPDLPLSAPIPPIDVVPAGPVANAPPLPAPAPGDCPACTVSRSALTLGALAERLGDPVATACAPALRYSAAWATRLPPDLQLPPSARVIEAAGSDGPACHLRAIAYGVAMPVAPLLASEYVRLIRVGFSVTHQAAGDLHVLAARRARDGTALTLLARDVAGIADVRLVITGTR
ncbi:hypothetical protein JW805_02535 [Roseomonas aeriglobus]|nr:hypothetical protein [Roseomonas aeriglobus]